MCLKGWYSYESSTVASKDVLHVPWHVPWQGTIRRQAVTSPVMTGLPTSVICNGRFTTTWFVWVYIHMLHMIMSVRRRLSLYSFDQSWWDWLAKSPSRRVDATRRPGGCHPPEYSRFSRWLWNTQDSQDGSRFPTLRGCVRSVHNPSTQPRAGASHPRVTHPPSPARVRHTRARVRHTRA